MLIDLFRMKLIWNLTHPDFKQNGEQTSKREARIRNYVSRFEVLNNTFRCQDLAFASEIPKDERTFRLLVIDEYISRFIRLSGDTASDRQAIQNLCQNNFFWKIDGAKDGRHGVLRGVYAEVRWRKIINSGLVDGLKNAKIVAHEPRFDTLGIDLVSEMNEQKIAIQSKFGKFNATKLEGLKKTNGYLWMDFFQKIVPASYSPNLPDDENARRLSLKIQEMLC